MPAGLQNPPLWLSLVRRDCSVLASAQTSPLAKYFSTSYSVLGRISLIAMSVPRYVPGAGPVAISGDASGAAAPLRTLIHAAKAPCAKLLAPLDVLVLP